MPLVHISLRRGKPAAYLDALADGIHRAMVEAFDVPPDDRFQTMHQLAADELRYDAHYLGGPRSADFVLVEITAGRPRNTATKEAFYRCLADRLQARPGLHPADLMVVITTTQRDEWSFGHGLATLLQPANS